MSFESMPAPVEIVRDCPHGKNKAECEKCALENEPVWQTIKSLQEKSRFKRTGEYSPDTDIEIEGKKFKVELIDNGKDPALSDVQKFFEKTFGEEEVDPEEILRGAVDGLSVFGEEEPKYRIITVRNDKNELVSTCAGAPLDLKDKEGKPTDEMVYFVGYAVTDPGARQGGLAREAYISALIDASQQAKLQGKSLKFAFGECTYTSEKFWNNVSWKRIYNQTGDKKEYTELKYVQPALDFDENSGLPAEGAGAMPEHLMIDGFGVASPSAVEVKQAYEAMINYNVDWPKQAFSSNEAFDAHREYIAKFRKDFNESFNDNDKLIYLDIKDREKAKKLGVKVHEYTEADHGEAGDEDF